MRKNMVSICCCLFLWGAVSADLFGSSKYLSESRLQQNEVALRYNLASGSGSADGVLYASDEGNLSDNLNGGDDGYQYKSPGKAFAMSLLVPGLGQYYTGSKIKPVIFLGAEITSWVLYFKWQGEGDDITDEFEAFNRTHWSEADYSWYLENQYDASDDDSITGVTEINHHLPDTRTQQYYEMTGKYDQFSWGWDDAVLNDSTLDDHQAGGTVPPPVNAEVNIPYSANRDTYETMRNDANDKYDDARRMIYVSILNRLISGFEAMFSAKKHNSRHDGDVGGADDFSAISVDAKFRSYYEAMDTPYITFKLRFK